MKLGPAGIIFPFGVALLLAASCGRVGYDSLETNLDAGDTGVGGFAGDGAGGTGTGGDTGAAGSGDAGTGGTTGAGGTMGIGGTTGVGGTMGAGGATGTGGTTGIGGATGTGGTTGIGGATGTGGTTGIGGATGTGGTTGVGGATGTGGTTGVGGAGQGGSVDSGSADTASGDGGAIVTCGQAGTPIRIWSFDADIEGWELSGQGTMIWNGTVGMPAAGALQVDRSSGPPTHPRYVQAFGDLRGRIVTARVFVESGSVGFKVFAQTGTRLVWGDGGQVTPPVGQWTCIAMSLDNPSFSNQQYDPSDVQIIGVEVAANTTSRVYIDTVTY